ncbi:MAG: hypothetical protein QW303_02970, partial [Nitrososphaerota archaeon]
MAFSIDLTGLGTALSTIGERIKEKKAEELYQQALASTSPEEIQQTLLSIARLSPKLHFAVAPQLQEKASALQQAGNLVPALTENLSTILPPEDIKTIQELAKTNPESAIKFLGELFTKKVGDLTSAKSQLDIEAGPIGEELFQVRKRRGLEQLEEELALKSKAQLKQLEESLKLRSSFQTGATGTGGMSLDKIRSGSLSLVHTLGKTISDNNNRLTEILEDPRIKGLRKAFKLPSGGVLDDLSVIHLASSKELEKELKGLNIPPTEENITAIKDRYNKLADELDKDTTDLALEVGDIINKNVRLIQDQKRALDVYNEASIRLGIPLTLSESLIPSIPLKPALQKEETKESKGILTRVKEFITKEEVHPTVNTFVDVISKTTRV